MCNEFKLGTSQEFIQKEKVQIFCMCVSVDSTIGLDLQNYIKAFRVKFSTIYKVITFNYKLIFFLKNERVRGIIEFESHIAIDMFKDFVKFSSTQNLIIIS